MENCREIDPDYASHNIALKRAEKIKEENLGSVEKLKEILHSEFNKELSLRQNEIEQVEKQIYKTQKLLHLMRYVLINSCYTGAELEYNGNEDNITKAGSSYLFDQNRIHPALKKLLGKNTTAPDLSICRSARRMKSEHKANLLVENLNGENSLTPNSTTNNPSVHQGNDGNTKNQNLGFERNRQKIKNRIIVGNISKWMPSYEDDNLTHKWMMYVRGPKENPDVSHFIEKVVFYLHPSYKPHDVVEVDEPPFHLSRRGWGEFPIRVQIHFTCTLNKPVDIVHNLKLDKTYSGRQTLGNESIIDLYLYDDKITDNYDLGYSYTESSVFEEEKPTLIKKHEIVAVTDICEKTNVDQQETIQNSVPTFEHDYCTDDVKPVIHTSDIKESNECSQSDHSYSHPPSYEFLNIVPKKDPPQYIEQEDNPLIHGLDEFYSETNEDMTKKEPLYYRKTLVYTTTKNSSSNIPKSGSKIIAIKRRSEGTADKKHGRASIEKLFINKEDKISLPRRNHVNISKFKNIGEALPYLFKRLPLISESAGDVNYKSMYSFTCATVDEYLSWNIAKQSSAEWSRAKFIKNILARENIHEHHKWNTKAVMMYGRSHGYTPRSNFSLFEKKSAESILIDSCFKSSVDNPFVPICKAEQSIDIEDDSENCDNKRVKLTAIDISDPLLQSQCSYVREEALECGLVLKNENIDTNIIFNGAERMILEAVKCLADHLVRRSLHHAVCDNSYGTQIGEINSVHVNRAIAERRELDTLREHKLKRKEMKYFFQ